MIQNAQIRALKMLTSVQRRVRPADVETLCRWPHEITAKKIDAFTAVDVLAAPIASYTSADVAEDNCGKSITRHLINQRLIGGKPLTIHDGQRHRLL